jgi:Do/DeqQ family serine protease
VVEGASKVRVELSDRRSFSAKVVGADAPSDLAVLKIEASDLPALAFGDSDAMRVGDVVLAFGNPLGVGQTVTMGIVSAKGRATDVGDGNFEDFLQTDAPINQGNSGGALVNTAGQLVGINTQILTPTGGNIGIGFAIPSRMAEGVMTQLVSGGRVERGQLGVTVQGVSSDMAASLGLKEVKGALVSDVSQGSPAEKAGLKRGDVIVSVDGVAVDDGNALRNRIASTRPGSTVAVGLVRDGAPKTVRVELREIPSGRAAAEKSEPAEGGRLGLSVRPLTREEARELGLESRGGLLVAEVDPAGPAAAAGLEPGDVIEEVDRKPVREASELRAAVKAAGSRPALVLVSRKGSSLFLTIDPPSA